MSEHPQWHIPVMVAEVMRVLNPGPRRLLVDCTVGDGGHAAAWLEAGGSVVGIDRDHAALDRASRRCAPWHDRLHLVHGRFSQLAALLPLGALPDAALLDLGTSCVQLETPGRGFSYMDDGPLDMRMDQVSGYPLAEVLRGASADELASWLHELGDVPHARRIARVIMKAGPPTTTGGLAAVIERQVPQRMAMKTLSCVFQALRMVVNQEPAEVDAGLSAALETLRSPGRMAVLTYHSGEERAVRRFVRRESGQCSCPPGLPVCACDPRRRVRVLEKGRRPDPQEVAGNQRARSARLWAMERTDAQ